MTTQLPPAIAQVASQAEAEAGTATDKFMTPERVRQAIVAYLDSVIPVWLRPVAGAVFDGNPSVTIAESHNIASITRTGTGKYSVTFTNAMADANYIVLTNGTRGNPESAYDQSHAESKTTTGFVLSTGVYSSGAVQADFDLIHFVVHGELA